MSTPLWLAWSAALAALAAHDGYERGARFWRSLFFKQHRETLEIGKEIALETFNELVEEWRRENEREETLGR